MKEEEKDFFVTLGNRLQNVRKKDLGISVEKLAEDIGVSVNQVRKYEQGRDRISLNTLVKLEKKYNIPVSYFYTKKVEGVKHFYKKDRNVISSVPYLSGSQTADLGIDKSKYQILPVIAFAGAGEFIDLTELEPIDKLLIPKEFAANGSTVIVKVAGASMEPMIKKGAYIGVDKDDKQFISGEIYAIYLPYEGAVIKRVYLDLDNIILKSENKNFPDVIMPTKKVDRENFIIGRVKWVLQKF